MHALLAHHELPSGAVVRLRLPQAADVAGLTRLGAGAGRLDEDVARSLVRFDPRDRAVACATSLGARGEQVVGVAAIDLRADAAPDVLAVDERFGDDLRALLSRVLRERATAHDRHVARRGPSRRPSLLGRRTRGHRG